MSVQTMLLLLAGIAGCGFSTTTDAEARDRATGGPYLPVPIGPGDLAGIDIAPGSGDDTGAPGDTGATGDDTGSPPGDDTGPPGDTGTPGDDTGSSPGDDTGTPASLTCSSWGEPMEVGSVVDSSLVEISGIRASRRNPGILWVLEDSGGPTILTALDTSGATVGTLMLTGVRNVDWEDLAIAPCGDTDCLWVGDVGDNALSRDDYSLMRVEEPTITGDFDLSVEPDVFPFRYPSGHNNVEALAVADDGLPILVTKRVDGTADVFRMATLEPGVQVTLEEVATITTGGQATGADILPDGSRLLVRTYTALLEYPLTRGLPSSPTELPSPDEPQGEAVGYDLELGGAWLTSEGTQEPLWFVPCEG